MTKWISILAVIFFFSACSKNDSQNGSGPNITPKDGPPFVQNTVTVLDSAGKPISNAKVLIGTEIDKPFPNNYFQTDANGQVSVPTAWQTELPVTIDASGFIRSTYLHQVPGSLIFQLHAADILPAIEVSGTATNFSSYITDKDGYIDFALVLPMIKKSDLFFFNVANLLSNEKDNISVYGQQISLPTNMSLPKQTEKIGIFSFTVEKPIYKFKVATPGVYDVAAIRGRALLDDLRNQKDPIALINSVAINGGGTLPVTVGTAPATLNIPINQLQFTGKISVAAPTFASSLVMYAIPIVAHGDSYYPSDFKALKSKETRSLNIPPNGSTNILAVLTSTDQTQTQAISASVNQGNQSTQIAFLPIVTAPQVSTSDIKLQPPTSTMIATVGTYLTISNVRHYQVNGADLQFASRNWEIYSNNWESDIQMPSFPTQTITEDTYTTRYEVSFFGQTQSSTHTGSIFENATQVTRSSVDR